jgi:ethylbenzene dioxygenase alpha subunit
MSKQQETRFMNEAAYSPSYGPSAADLRAMVDVEHGRISRRIFWDDAIYQLELLRIFARCWLFVAHESQLP